MGKINKTLEKKIAEIFQLIQKYKDMVLPMDILSKLTKIQNMDFDMNETLRVKFIALILREHRKFKEVANVRQHRKQA
jgi:hypothetical protein